MEEMEADEVVDLVSRGLLEEPWPEKGALLGEGSENSPEGARPPSPSSG